MSGLVAPPTKDKPSRALARILVLIVLLVAAAAVIWTAVTQQRIDLAEDTAYEDIEVAGAAFVNGMTINAEHHGLGSLPVILLHDFDIAGGALWDPVIDSLGTDVTAVSIDLPGFGLSSRIPEEGNRHTVAAMAEVVSQIIDERFRQPVVLAGVGLGGKVASEVALVNPGLVRGLVMIDVDFYSDQTWIEFTEKLPFFGPAVTFTVEGGGVLSRQIWAPDCGEGGWCPTQAESNARSLAESIEGSTASLRAFRRTPPSSFVPAKLPEISVPTAFVWSSDGPVPRESVDRVQDALPSIKLVTSDVWKAHLEDAGSVAEAVIAVAG